MRHRFTRIHPAAVGSHTACEPGSLEMCPACRLVWRETVAAETAPNFEALMNVVAIERKEKRQVPTTHVPTLDHHDDPQPRKTTPFDLCFFAMGDSFVRVRGGEHGMYGFLRQITYRCGLCGQPVTEDDLQKHFDEHREALGAA